MDDDLGRADEQRYVFDNAWEDARSRLAAFEGMLNPGTFRHLDGLGVSAGWRCLEVGGGGGSVTEWLCDRVGPEGRVLATDIDTRFLRELERANLDVREHDITRDDLPEAAFDLIHVRGVLIFLAEPEAALASMVRALKPGGWLLAEEADTASVQVDPASRGADTFNAVFPAILERQQALGFHAAFGRRLFGHVRRAGLERLDSEGRSFAYAGGSVGARFHRLNAEQLRADVVASGGATDAEIDRYQAVLDDPDFCFLSSTFVAVWGRKQDAER